MPTSSSKSEANRRTGKHQVDQQRTAILDAAELRFLQNGLENTSMIDIAIQACISRVTLYRYFANRDEIALEIQVRMLNKINTLVTPPDQEFSLTSQKLRAQSIIANFGLLREAYRYIGMFDKIYLDNAPDTALTQWTKEQLTAWDWGRPALGAGLRNLPHANQLHVILNTITWFLEKLALRGELTWSDKDVPLEEDLRIFEEMIVTYFDRLIELQAD
ncbi:MAG: TetR/AcrR family transcriptional regulator [Anaerolineaceae bacterium]|nr:TetR/AcrR family transcriptional regulator [Anaerolineaceae bacterium]